MASETEESVSTQGYGNVAHDLNGTDLYISSVKQLISALPDPSGMCFYQQIIPHTFPFYI